MNGRSPREALAVVDDGCTALAECEDPPPRGREAAQRGGLHTADGATASEMLPATNEHPESGAAGAVRSRANNRGGTGAPVTVSPERRASRGPARGPQAWATLAAVQVQRKELRE